MIRNVAQRTARREALLDAATAVMGEQGVAESRLADIGRRAGISTGQVLYYFESKADLFVQALARVESELREEILTALEGLGGEAALDALLERAAPSGPGDFRLLLWLEAWALAPRDPAIAARVQALEDDWIDLLADVLVRAGVAEVEAPTVALSLSALMDGLTIQVVVGSRRVDRDTMLAICRAAVDRAHATEGEAVAPHTRRDPPGRRAIGSP